MSKELRDKVDEIINDPNYMGVKSADIETLIRTATLDEVEIVIDSQRTYSPPGDSIGFDKYIDKKQLKPAIDNMRSNDD